MNIHLGTLEIIPVSEHPELVAKTVASGLSSLSNVNEVGVTKIDPNLSDTAEFCEHYHIGMNQAANCVVLEAKHGDRTWYAACVILGSTRVDVNGMTRRTLGARRVSFAPMEHAVTQTGMEYGAITPPRSSERLASSC